MKTCTLENIPIPLSKESYQKNKFGWDVAGVVLTLNGCWKHWKSLFGFIKIKLNKIKPNSLIQWIRGQEVVPSTDGSHRMMLTIFCWTPKKRTRCNIS
jgi:hypothetical protein